MSTLDSRTPQAPPAPEPAPGPAPPTGPRGAARWAADLAMGARFALTGGRESWIRTVLTAVGVGLGVAVLMVAASVPNMLGAREARGEARENFGFGPVERSDHSALYTWSDTEFRGEGIRGRYIEPEGSSPPVPPGVEGLPGPGEMLVSPALGELLASPEGELLRERLSQRVVGTIGDEGLLGPKELTFLAGSDTLSDFPDSAMRIDRFDEVGEPEPLDAVLLLLVVVVCVVLLFPVWVFIATSVRFGGERRDRRLAALRLVGADSRMVRRIAAGESLVGALLGLAVGAALLLPVRALIGRAEFLDISVFPADVRPSAPLVALIAVAVPVSAVVVTLFALRGVAIEPLGVVRDAGVRRRRLWWRLVPPGIGLVLLLPLVGGIDAERGTIDTYRIAAGIVLLLVGVTTVLPWLVEWVVNRMRGGPLAFQLAVRRLQLDSGPGARAVSGITVAVAGAIAVQMLFGGVEGDYTRSTGHDTSRADLQVMRDLRDGRQAWELTERLEDIRGVDRVLGAAVLHAPEAGTDPNGDRSWTRITVAGCATLEQLARLRSCEEGDVFVAPPTEDGAEEPGARPGARLDLNIPVYSHEKEAYERTGEPRPWSVPADAPVVVARPDAMGRYTAGVLATPGALDLTRVTQAHADVSVKLDPAVPDAVEHIRNAVETGSPETRVMTLSATDQSNKFAAVQRALYAGAAGVMLLIGASMVVSTLEQLRERRKLLSVLVAFGTRRSTLGWSVLWQTALPVALGLVLSVAGGIGLGAVLLKLVSTPVAVHWTSLGAMTGIGAGVVLLVTALSLPPLWRMMRPDGLRTE
ncbi:FtsX-like permease family protein [Streptomyces radiopugnans]|uniref:FtsX-like permease family protein n=1 Tax=Streptomyces radiopugnans TaxID=403935 RepID=A0A1H9HFI2_9ACTN|nr:ABC transporter permease [Streptomyces radiopugnans]SEQ61143.1 FtsX-like permease family protein [Streptomyces radiopugnans]